MLVICIFTKTTKSNFYSRQHFIFLDSLNYQQTSEVIVIL